MLGGPASEKKALAQRANPLTHLTKDAPPFLFFHGDKDKLVGLEQSKTLAEKLQKAGASAKVVIVEGEGHGWAGEKLKQNIEQMVSFLDENLKKK